MNVHHAEPVIKIFSKPVLGDGSLQIDIGRGKDTRIDMERLMTADPFERVLLQKPEQLDL
jgi:hypothetical protein